MTFVQCALDDGLLYMIAVDRMLLSMCVSVDDLF